MKLKKDRWQMMHKNREIITDGGRYLVCSGYTGYMMFLSRRTIMPEDKALFTIRTWGTMGWR